MRVHDPSGRPSYWLVPVQCGEAVVGFVRVLSDGHVGASIALRAEAAVTGIDPGEVRRRAAETIDAAAGERCGDVLLVHDGPPGREAWRVDVLREGRLARWLFVTPSGTYSRPAGEPFPSSRE